MVEQLVQLCIVLMSVKAYDGHFGLALWLHSEGVWHLKTSILVLEQEESLVWFLWLSILRSSQDDLNGVASTKGNWLRERLIDRQPKRTKTKALASCIDIQIENNSQLNCKTVMRGVINSSRVNMTYLSFVAAPTPAPLVVTDTVASSNPHPEAA